MDSRARSHKAREKPIEDTEGEFMGLKLGSCAGRLFELPLESLLTHFVVLGATGSGKTGLLTVLIEELAAVGVASIVIDVKGDLANLSLRDEKWIERAVTEGLTELKLPESVIYTPGFCGGRPLKLLPQPAGDPLSSAWAASSLLSLTAFSRDRGAHALLTALLQWKGATTLNALARLVLEPPPAVLASIPVEIMMPESFRRRLARELAALAVDPVISCFSKGDDLDLEAPPPIKVVYLAHLPENLRALAISLILSNVYRRMTSWGGSCIPKLAIVFDEVRGYLPPHPRNPPTKEPLMTLVRQGRGFGVSMLLATQNPKDLDYKALSNVGTWAIGVLRAKQDREAVAEAVAEIYGISRSEISSRIASLKPREFLLLSNMLDQPLVVKVRHTLTPLRGPLTLDTLSRIYGWHVTWQAQYAMPQSTLVTEKPAMTYKPCILARGTASYNYPGRKTRTLKEFTAIIDIDTRKVTLLDNPPAVEPGPPREGLTAPIDSIETLYSITRQLLTEALTEKIPLTNRGDKPKQGESTEEFVARVASELEARRRVIDEKYMLKLEKLIGKAEKISKKKREISSLINVLEPLLSRGVTRAALVQTFERWRKAREKAVQLNEMEKEILTEIERLRAKWLEELKRLEIEYAVKVVEVRPDIIRLQLEILWIPELA